jgi:hypothetical protein
VVLPQPEAVRVASGKAAEIEMDTGEPCDLRLLPLGEESICNAALIEDLRSRLVVDLRSKR